MSASVCAAAVLLDVSKTLLDSKQALLAGRARLNAPLLRALRVWSDDDGGATPLIGVVSNTSRAPGTLAPALDAALAEGGGRSPPIKLGAQVYNTRFERAGDLVRKPSPWMVWKALGELGVPCGPAFARAVFVGDKRTDAAAARAAGVAFVYAQAFNNVAGSSAALCSSPPPS